MSIVIALSGQIASGKSHVAHELADRTGWGLVSFGDYVRSKVSDANRDDRSVLQETGAMLIEELGWERFCLEVLEYSGVGVRDVPCIVEGVRHEPVLDTLRGLFAPTNVKLVYIAVPEPARYERLASSGVNHAQARQWQEHSTEVDTITKLRARADLVVTSDDNASTRILGWVEESTDSARIVGKPL